MHAYRLCYIFLGLVIYIQSAFCRTCGSDFDDIASRTYLGDIVFEGHYDSVYGRQPPPSTGNSRSGRQSGWDAIYQDTIRYQGTFSVKRVMKGQLPKDETGRKFARVVVGEFGPPDPEGCVAPIGLPGLGDNSTYIVFLKDNINPHRPVYKISGYPVLSTKENLRTVKKIACEDCGEY